MDDAWFDEISREHRRALQAIDRLEEALRVASASGDKAAVLGAVCAFLHDCEVVLEPHMEAEEREVYPLLDRYLPAEIESSEAMLREHETARGLVALLRRGRERLSHGAVDAESEVATLVQDLALLLRDHIRKEEGVINPLLRQLLRERRHA